MSALSLAGCLACLATGCARCGDEPEAGSEPSASNRRNGRPTARPDLPTPTVEQLPLPQDFAQHAGQEVTEETYRAQLERIELEIGPVADEPPPSEGADRAIPRASSEPRVTPDPG